MFHLGYSDETQAALVIIMIIASHPNPSWPRHTHNPRPLFPPSHALHGEAFLSSNAADAPFAPAIR